MCEMNSQWGFFCIYGRDRMRVQKRISDRSGESTTVAVPSQDGGTYGKFLEQQEKSAKTNKIQMLSCLIFEGYSKEKTNKNKGNSCVMIFL